MRAVMIVWLVLMEAQPCCPSRLLLINSPGLVPAAPRAQSSLLIALAFANAAGWPRVVHGGPRGSPLLWAFMFSGQRARLPLPRGDLGIQGSRSPPAAKLRRGWLGPSGQPSGLHLPGGWVGRLCLVSVLARGKTMTGCGKGPGAACRWLLPLGKVTAAVQFGWWSLVLPMRVQRPKELAQDTQPSLMQGELSPNAGASPLLSGGLSCSGRPSLERGAASLLGYSLFAAPGWAWSHRCSLGSPFRSLLGWRLGLMASGCVFTVRL